MGSILKYLLSIVAAITIAEIYFRHNLYENEAQKSTLFVVYSEDILSNKRAQIRVDQNELYRPPSEGELQKPEPHIGHFNQSHTVMGWFLNKDNQVVLENRFRTNNLGFLSAKDYSLKPQSHEYRITVLGDSITGVNTNNHPWVDQLEDLLDNDGELLKAMGVDHIKVYNIGEPGAGFGQFAANYFNQAKFFRPDLVIVNYIENDFPRGWAPPPAPAPLGQPKVYGTGWIAYSAGGGGEYTAKVYVTCTAAPISLKNPTCTPQSFLIMGEKLVHSPDKIANIRLQVVKDYLSGAPSTFGIPLGLMALAGYDVSYKRLRSGEVQRDFRNLVRRGASAVGLGNLLPKANAATIDLNNPEIVLAATSIGKILDDHPNVLITLTTTFFDVYPKKIEYEKTQALESRDPRIKTIFTRDVLPIPKSENEFRSWFNLPYDGHFSDKGADIYAQGMYCVVRKRLEEEHGLNRKPCMIVSHIEAALIFVEDFQFVNQSGVGSYSARGPNIKLQEGKWYWEVASPNAGFEEGKLADTIAIGVSSANYASDAEVGTSQESWGWRGDGHRLAQGSVTKFGPGLNKNSDIVMVALDAGAGRLWIGLNGTWFNGGDPESGKNPTFEGIVVPVTPVVSSKHGSSGTAIASVSFAAKSWKYDAPHGYRPVTDLSAPRRGTQK